MKSKFLAAAILAAVTGTAYAAAPAFEAVDTNKDGSIAADEAKAVEGLDFTKADANGDGKLSKEEYAAATKKM